MWDSPSAVVALKLPLGSVDECLSPIPRDSRRR